MSFRKALPLLQTALAGILGGWGLWQRNQILSHDYPFFGSGWNSTARFHVWPWPFKFAAIENLPALLAGFLVSWPIDAAQLKLPETAAFALSLLFVPPLWYWVGLRLDQRYGTRTEVPWTSVAVFTAVCLAGSILQIGYVGYVEYGMLVWVVAAVPLSRLRKSASRS